MYRQRCVTSFAALDW